MTVTINVPCRYCQQTEPVRKHGFGKTGEPRYYCRACLRSFQINYRYNAHKQEVKETIVDMALNGSGVRDTVRTLKVGINTVIRTLKNSRQNR
ncbi:hypothetical protein QB833_002035 [Salmonella enterica]|nr:hypothetical protein [Salmonella enterica]